MRKWKLLNREACFPGAATLPAPFCVVFSGSRWDRANQVTAERQQKLEESANQLASFQAAEAQLRPWLMEKELMMSVLGPLSIDPNMLNAQKQQVQVREAASLCLLCVRSMEHFQAL